MSTKIYNAFKFKKELNDLIPFLTTVRNDIEKHTLDYYSSIIGPDQYSIFDLTKKFKNAKMLSSFDYNLDSCVIVYLHQTGVYLQFFFPGHFGNYNDQGFYKKWEHYIEDFHYQNQTDPPTDISRETWEEREKTWDEILAHSDIPSRNGLIWEINSNEYAIAKKIINRNGR